MINVGSKNGARLGQAVMSSFALVGVLVEVTDEYSRVLLVTDLNSQIPVKIQNSSVSGILIGDNSRSAKLFFLPQESVLAAGQVVTTSGRGGVLPPDLPIGVHLPQAVGPGCEGARHVCLAGGGRTGEDHFFGRLPAPEPQQQGLF